MAGYIGNYPTAIPLTGADLTDGIITSAKIADGTIVGADINTTFDLTGKTVTGAGGGKVLQVVSTNKTDTFSSASSATFTDITGMSVSITPSSASSKIFILYNLSYGVDPTGVRTFIKLLRDSTAVGIGDTASNRIRTNNFVNNSMISATSSVVSSFLDSPSTTSAITYKLQVASDSASYTIFVNRGSQDSDNTTYGRASSQITVMEIAG